MVLLYTTKKMYKFFFPPDSASSHELTDKNPPSEASSTSPQSTNTSSKACRHGISPRCEACVAARRAQLTYRWKIILGLFLPFTVSALGVTIIASALPWIAADFGELAQLNWIISAFNLTSAAFIPFWGQIADILGRHTTIQAATLIMVVGSALCAAAPTNAFAVLLLGRAIQGLGSAGMDISVRAIVADKVSLGEGAKNWSIFTFIGGVSYGIGPVIGGYLTSADWRWCFGINLPVGVVASSWTIDVGGQVLCLLGFSLLILSFTWAGATYGWNTPAVLVPLISSVFIIGAFVWWEYQMVPGNMLARRFKHQRAMIHWEVLVNRDIALLFYTSFATGMAMYSVMYFCNFYFTMVKQLGADEAGVQLLYFIPGLAAGVYAAMYMCNINPGQTWHPIFFGSVIQALGTGLLAWACWIEHDATVYGMMALSGVGVGMRLMPVPLHGMGYFPQRKAAVISLAQVSGPLGGTLGLTVMTTVFNNVAGIESSGSDFTALHDMDASQLAAMARDARKGIVMAYISISPFMVLCVVAAAMLGNVFIARTKEGEDERENEIYPGVFFWAWIRGEAHISEKPEILSTTRPPVTEGCILPQVEDRETAEETTGRPSRSGP
ncbi:Efflux pump FUS6 like protein [Verticillium longisporum]|uniref:Efflux pump FUS6 like protein n=1 Tax=Verticillium longisporum TaxID=100787 RepID=A0A8I2ZYE8_VERLO|nr:Efflux pump FUS6 like protein [Verticillium longisporum]